MPSYDLARERFRLAHPHLGVLGLLHDNEPVVEELIQARDELIEIGLVSDEGEISPVLSDLVAVMSKPVIQVLVEVTGAQGIMTHGLVIGEEAVFAHEEWPGTGESEYVQIEPATVVFELARIVGLRQRARAEARPPVLSVESTMGALDAVLNAIGEMAPEEQDQPGATGARGRQVLTVTDEELDHVSRGVFADLISALRANWRMTVVWPSVEGDTPGTGAASFAVWDCGHFGYWHRELPAEPIVEGQVGPETPLRLVQVPTKKVWKMITDLLPNRDQIRSTAA
ncbi:hypothetical protein [Streptomyces sp. B6B3]|uniref:hypothetical protein n=1 Tax=Streptomyces sp. B6B3 TaxID=3153570 RepID=UPI00325EFBA5